MTFDDLADFIENKMGLSYIYQIALIKTLVESGGSATLQYLAYEFFRQEENQCLSYDALVQKMPVNILETLGVVETHDDLISLADKQKLSFTQTAHLKMLCEQRLQGFAHKSGKDVYEAVQALCPTSDRSNGNKDDTDVCDVMETISDCPFCYENIKSRIIESYHSVVTIKDDFPVGDGHMLIIPKRHCTDFFHMTQAEQIDANHLLKILHERISHTDSTVTGFNVGMNTGESAGQTIFHCHIHLIPRRDGDTPNPRGGVRGVIPDKMNY